LLANALTIYRHTFSPVLDSFLKNTTEFFMCTFMTATEIALLIGCIFRVNKGPAYHVKNASGY